MADLALSSQAASMEESGQKLFGESNLLGSNADPTIYGFRQVVSSLHLRLPIYEMRDDESKSAFVIFLSGLNEVMHIRYLVIARVTQSVPISQNMIFGSARSVLPRL